MRFVGLEEQLRLCARLRSVHAVNRAGPAGRYVEPPSCVEGQVPDVVGFGSGLGVRAVKLRCIKNHRGTGVVLLLRRGGIEFVNLAAGQGGGIERAIGAQPNNLHADVFGLEKGKGLPSGPTRRTVAGEAVPGYAAPVLSAATDQTNVEGVVTTSRRPGPSRRCPSLCRATPCGVPFSNSSGFDCGQRWVPCACAGKARAARRRRRRVRKDADMLRLSLLKFVGGRGVGKCCGREITPAKPD